MDGTGCWDLPTDVLVEILLRLPPSSRRRARLVCRHWRDVVGEHTTEMRSRAKALLWWNAAAYVVADLSSSSTGSCMELWRTDGRSKLVGTCNGLLCLCNNEEVSSGAITLVNPATSETLPLPPLPCAGLFVRHCRWTNWHEAYSFAYHPISGRYKLVHVPCSFGNVYEFDNVHALTLGETSWREVSTDLEGKARCNLRAGIVSIDGITHWVTNGAAPRVVSFDLEDERITSFTELPSQTAGPNQYHLTEVHGRLGIVIRDLSVTTEVWVMEKGRRWSRRYSLRRQYLPWPHIVYGEYILTREESSLHAHHRKKRPSLSGEVVQVGHRDHGTLVANIKGGNIRCRYRTFAYVETTEPLSVYEASKY
ncbi:hypothetical protein ZWY2020_012266 [Hordeum vulgare]|nr:hypothetical protein ZWY2020_012266 [Hordeum vulgare]